MISAKTTKLDRRKTRKVDRGVLYEWISKRGITCIQKDLKMSSRGITYRINVNERQTKKKSDIPQAYEYREQRYTRKTNKGLVKLNKEDSKWLWSSAVVDGRRLSGRMVVRSSENLRLLYVCVNI